MPAGSTYRPTGSIPFVSTGLNVGAPTISVPSGGIVGRVVGGIVAGATPNLPAPTEVVITDANVTGVRWVVPRPTPQTEAGTG